MVTSTNHVIAGPDLHRAEPLAFWGFLQDLSAKYSGRSKKVLGFERGSRQLVLRHYGQFGPG